MPSQWYTSQITWQPIYAVGITDGNGNQIRHFTDTPPLLGALTKCGLSTADGDDSNITDTCVTCSLAVCAEKYVPPPIDAGAVS